MTHYYWKWASFAYTYQVFLVFGSLIYHLNRSIYDHQRPYCWACETDRRYRHHTWRINTQDTRAYTRAYPFVQWAEQSTKIYCLQRKIFRPLTLPDRCRRFRTLLWPASRWEGVFWVFWNVWYGGREKCHLFRSLHRYSKTHPTSCTWYKQWHLRHYGPIDICAYPTWHTLNTFYLSWFFWALSWWYLSPDTSKRSPVYPSCTYLVKNWSSNEFW